MAKKANEGPVSDRRQALENAMQQLKKKYGTGSVMMMNDESVQSVETISTGSIALDSALGVGGLPRGR
ncbi:MAG: DNA recombination/repair protein RecA, partial [Lachnospiraceae bacterium]|nr:DNA recombination/repair protein RecA [Lachnospiraceae bacterium]